MLRSEHPADEGDPWGLGDSMSTVEGEVVYD